MPAKNHSRYRNRLLVSVAGVIVVAIAAFFFLGNNSNTASSRQTAAASDQPLNVLADNGRTTGADGHGPSIYFPESSYDFGSISQGDKVSHTFVVQNTGDKPLKLIRAHGS